MRKACSERALRMSGVYQLQARKWGRWVAALGGLTSMAFAATSYAQTADSNSSLPSRAASLLSVRCLTCHNPQKRSGGIDLSTRELAIKTGALAPGDAVNSQAAIQTLQGKMPPDGRLSKAETTLLHDWIEAGANYSRPTLEPMKPKNKTPWSLFPIKATPVPKTHFDALSSNPIDRFLFAKLEKLVLRPAAPAARRELLRRVSIDLTGLPPSISEIEAFQKDASPNAYEKVVDRLLASPAYGERWARHWLDVVRYGESNGYEQNHLRANSWPYRDYVIRAFNHDKPYDRFVTEQIAGDIVSRGDPDNEVATGFLVAGIHDTVPILTEEGTRQQRANDLDDIVSTTGVTFLGISINCAKCHDHKFDPIPCRDYYRLTSVFAGIRHGERDIKQRPLSDQDQQAIKGISREIADNEQKTRQLLHTVERRLLSGTNSRRAPVSATYNEELFAPQSAKFVRFTISATSTGNEPCLDELEVYGPTLGGPNLALASAGSIATASSVLPGFAIHQVAHLNDGLYGNDHSWISNERGTGWVQIELKAPAQVARVVWHRDAEKRLTDRVPTGYRLEISLDGKLWTQVSSSADRAVNSNQFTPEKLQEAMTRAERESYAGLEARQDALQQRLRAIMPVTNVYCGRFDTPEPIYQLTRGDVMHPGEQVRPGALSLIPGVSGELVPATALSNTPGLHLASSNSATDTLTADDRANPRVLLAKWICDPRNPLTSRVIVNRIWEHHFGHGIVDTPSDFGNMGSAPSHPDLLDWLASDLMSHGWKLKRLQRMIVTSYAYRQTSASNALGEAKDGDNRLLWHMPLRRMEAEAVRDSVLTVSGKLNLNAAGGPGFRLFKYSVLNVAIYDTREDQGPDTWRRSVYQIPARGIRDSILGGFDCPDSSERAAHRTSTTTALQALSMLNSRFMNEQAAFFAHRVLDTSPSSLDGQVRSAFRLAFGRSASAVEAQASAALIKRDGLATLCRALMNANEFLYY